MKLLFFAACLAGLIIGSDSQSDDVLDILQVLSRKMNLQLNVSDSLYPMKFISYRYFSLSKKEIKEIKLIQKHEKGVKLSASYIKNFKFIQSDSIYSALKEVDSEHINSIIKKGPFYMISKPLIFGNKALVDLDLLGREGITYLLIRKENGWTIAHQSLNWVN